MAGETLTLQIISPERLVLAETGAEFVVAPIAEGAMGILKNHAPMVGTLKPGVLRYKQNGKFVRVAVSGGFLELSHNKVTVLADTAEPGDSIDVMRAQEARKRAEVRLENRAANIDRARAEAALRRAIARLQAAGALGDKER